MLELQHTYDPARTEADYLRSIEGKTASLYATACRIGSLTAGLAPDHVQALTGFGLAYGMAFQVVDDILDVTATDDQLGKPAGHDLIEGVYTLPVLRTRRHLRDLPEGARVEIETTDPLAVIDIPHFCGQDGHRLVASAPVQGGHSFVIEKGGLS